MKKVILSISILGIHLFTSAQIDCSNGRYFTKIFSATTEATAVVYGSNKNWETNATQDLHITKITPTGDASVARPAILLFHGLNGSVNDVKATCVEYAKRGWVAFAVEYRKDGWASEFIQVGASGDYERQYREWQDGLAAVRFVRANASAYGVLPNRIYIGGFSRGAMTATNAGLLKDENSWDWDPAKLMANYGDKKASSPAALKNTSDAVAGVLSFFGRIIYSNIAGYYADVNHVPYAGIHCQDDNVVPVDCEAGVGCGSRAIYTQFKNNGVEAYGFFPATGGHAASSAMLDSSFLFMARMLGCSAPTAIDDMDETALSVFPNPIQNLLTVRVANTTFIELYDIQGKVLVQTKLKSGDNTIDMSFFSNGTYILKAGEQIKRIVKE